jgi:hypothetical protein
MGEVKPSGWLRAQMLRDIRDGFAGKLDLLAKEASSDIYVTGRNRRDAANSINGAHCHWWNGETEGNWRAGYIMLAYLTGDKDSMAKADAYVDHILASQDPDGYIGINAPELRYSDIGELWTQATLYRGLLDYAELTGSKRVFDAVKRAADHTIAVTGPGNKSFPRDGHDIMITDVMERLYYDTGDPKYRDFSVWLYLDFSRKHPEADSILVSLLHPGYPFRGHAVHAYELVRVPIWLAYATGRDDLGNAWRNGMDRIQHYAFPGGASLGQEDIQDRPPDPTKYEFEYCDSKEVQADLESAFEMSGLSLFADRTEQIFFNDEQGARMPDGSAITYLTVENRLRCDGKSTDGSADEPRNKFSPTHQTPAVCCNPNATQIAPLYVSQMWMRKGDDTLVAPLYGPCTLTTSLTNIPITIEEKTDYPFTNHIDLIVQPDHPATFSILLRQPAWSKGASIACADGAEVTREGSYWRVRKEWHPGDIVHIDFAPSIHAVPAINGELALQYGALLFAQPIASDQKSVKDYPVKGFHDTYLYPRPGADAPLALPASLRSQSFGFKPSPVENPDMLHPFDTPAIELAGPMIDPATGATKQVTLVPLGNASLLRRVTFPLSP